MRPAEVILGRSGLNFSFRRVFPNISQVAHAHLRSCSQPSSSFSKGNSESVGGSELEREKERERESMRDRMRVEFVALPQEISVAQAECSRGDCERESLALLGLPKQCQNQLPTHTRTHANTKKTSNAA